jgi:predicted nuclease of restriction endonuclease-like (RecB) superfamily
MVKNDLYTKQGKAISNFESSLPSPQGLLAQEVLKDPYNFDFLTLSENYREKDLEEALAHNITRFLLELGKGFAFVGRQMELRMPGGQTFYPDMTFYHTKPFQDINKPIGVASYELQNIVNQTLLTELPASEDIERIVSK